MPRSIAQTVRVKQPLRVAGTLEDVQYPSCAGGYCSGYTGGSWAEPQGNRRGVRGYGSGESTNYHIFCFLYFTASLLAPALSAGRRASFSHRFAPQRPLWCTAYRRVAAFRTVNSHPLLHAAVPCPQALLLLPKCSHVPHGLSSMLSISRAAPPRPMYIKIDLFLF